MVPLICCPSYQTLASGMHLDERRPLVAEAESYPLETANTSISAARTCRSWVVEQAVQHHRPQSIPVHWQQRRARPWLLTKICSHPATRALAVSKAAGSRTCPWPDQLLVCQSLAGPESAADILVLAAVMDPGCSSPGCQKTSPTVLSCTANGRLAKLYALESIAAAGRRYVEEVHVGATCLVQQSQLLRVHEASSCPSHRARSDREASPQGRS